MRTSLSIPCALIVAMALTSAPLSASPPTGLDHQRETPHLIFAWNDGAIDDEGLEYAIAHGERYYEAVRDLLGEPSLVKIVVFLHGPAQGADGSTKKGAIPRVDRSGNIHLYRFGPTFHGYFGPLSHELVHSFRIDRMPQHDWFFEEGFAEFVALNAGKSIRTFPWFGTPVDVAAAQWLVRGEEIPLRLLRDDHNTLNMPCKAQSYTLRSSFFVYVGRTYGNEALLKMATREKAGALDDYPRFFGKDFDTLTAEWRESLLQSWEAADDAAEQARRYREESPLKYMPVCRDGKQFETGASSPD